MLAKLDASGCPAVLLKQVGMTLVSTVGGASGPLYGTFFLRMSGALGDGSPGDFEAAFRAGVEGVIARGKAEPGDKTMLDALLPAADALTAAIGGGEPLDAATAMELGLVTLAPDDLDWEEELRIALEERASLSPDALTGMEANHRFVGPETLETKIFGRLTAWQNWIFIRPNASGPEGALRRFGSGTRADYDTARV